MQAEQVIRELRALGLMLRKGRGDVLFEAARLLEKELARAPKQDTPLRFVCPFCGKPVCRCVDRPRCRGCGQVLDWKAR